MINKILSLKISKYFDFFKFIKSNPKSESSLFNSLFRNAISAFGLRIIGTAFNFVLAIMLARLLSVQEFGIYNYTVGWATFLSIPALLGLDMLLIREIAVNYSKGQWSVIKGILKWSNQIVLLISVGGAGLATFIAWIVTPGEQSTLLTSFGLAMASLPMMALRNLRLSALQGLNKITSGLFPELVLAPIFHITLCSLFYFFLDRKITVEWVLLFRIFATACTLIIGILTLNKFLSKEIKESIPSYHHSAWLRSAIPFLMLGGMFIINTQTDILMLGIMKGPESSGLYAPVVKGALLISLLEKAGTTILAPNLASLYAGGHHEKLQQVVTKSTQISFLVSLPIAGASIIFGAFYLKLFGPEYVQGYYALIILCIGQLTKTSAISAGYLLNMTGHARMSLIGNGSSSIANIILNLFLIPLWGITGAAMATALSFCLERLITVSLVKKKLHINASFFSFKFNK